LCPGLHDRVPIGLDSTDHHSLAVEVDSTFTACRLAPAPGFDSEHTGGPDHDVIDVESVSDNVVEYLVTIRTQALEVLADDALAVDGLPKVPHLRPQTDDPPCEER
jgi:hypothetical protein